MVGIDSSVQTGRGSVIFGVWVDAHCGGFRWDAGGEAPKRLKRLARR
jgi:hypothetical protein